MLTFFEKKKALFWHKSFALCIICQPSQINMFSYLTRVNRKHLSNWNKLKSFFRKQRPLSKRELWKTFSHIESFCKKLFHLYPTNLMTMVVSCKSQITAFYTSLLRIQYKYTLILQSPGFTISSIWITSAEFLLSRVFSWSIASSRP